MATCHPLSTPQCRGRILRALLTSITLLLGLPVAPLLSAAPSSREHEFSTIAVASSLRARLSAAGLPVTGLTGAELADLVTLYGAAEFRPLWIDATGKPTLNVGQGLMILAGAAADGLRPGDYAVERLDCLLTAMTRATPPRIEDAVDFDLTMSASMLRYFRHLHMGRVDPRLVKFRLPVSVERHDFVTMLRAAVANQRIAETAEELRPPLVQYRLLRLALARYRTLASGDRSEPPPALATTVRPGDSFSAADALRRRLAALGDLREHAPGDRDVYGSGLVDAIKQFQLRHGLEPDGIIGPATRAALQVPLAWRVRQIELALERLRWLPDLGDQRFIALNIPMFQLWGWDAIPPSGTPSFGMRAIVGRALRSQTPVFIEEMRHVIFRPYWNVPRSILLNEILPIVGRDPEYLRRSDMEIVRAAGDDATPLAATAENLTLLRKGALRLRQRPGPGNALGSVKFVFPNNENVYLHGTPAQELFARTRRDFSHGCVRVEDPVTLAEWVLQEQPGWTRDRIVAAISGSIPQRVNLARPVQVILFYLTAAVMPATGKIHFADDIYRHDATLDRMLSR